MNMIEFFPSHHSKSNLSIPSQYSHLWKVDPSFRKGLGGTQAMRVVIILNCASKFLLKSGMTARKEVIYYAIHLPTTYNYSRNCSLWMNSVEGLFCYNVPMYYTNKILFIVRYSNFHCHIVLTAKNFSKIFNDF